MPIKGLTDDIAPRLPSLGKLRKGDEKPERGPGKDLTYFRFTGAKPEIEQAFEAAYGATPGTLTVYLPYATAEECFATWQEEWAAGGMVHRCDGQTMQIWRDGSGFARGAKPCPYFDGSKKRSKQAPGCDEVGRLIVVLPELIRAGYVGYVTLETHSKNDMLNILGSLRDAQSHAGAQGLAGIPFTLYRREEAISTPTDDGGRVTRKKWLVFIEPSAQWVQVRMAIAHAQALALPAGEIVDAETGEILDAPPARAQLPAPQPERQYTDAEIGKPFDAAPTAAPAAQKPKSNVQQLAEQQAAQKPPMQTTTPTQAPWDRFDALNDEAKGLGLPEVQADPATTTSDQLITLGKKLRADIDQAKAAKAQPAPSANAGKPTLVQLKTRLQQLADEAVALHLVGPAWAISPKWTEADIINAGKSLKFKIDEAKAKQKEPQHA